MTSPPVLPFFLEQGMIGEEQAAPSCDGAAEKMCTSPLPATVPAPAVSFSYASMAARPSTSFAVSGGDNTIGAAAAHIPESDVSKVKLFDSFARAILNRPVPGPVESPAGTCRSAACRDAPCLALRAPNRSGCPDAAAGMSDWQLDLSSPVMPTTARRGRRRTGMQAHGHCGRPACW